MASGGDDFLWVIQCPLLLFTKHGSKVLKHDFACARAAEGIATSWTIMLNVNEVGGTKCLGLWLYSNFCSADYGDSIERCLPRYALSVGVTDQVDLAFMSDVWIPPLNPQEMRGNDLFVSFNQIVDALQNSSENALTIRLQLQYRNQAGRQFALWHNSLRSVRQFAMQLFGASLSMPLALFSRATAINDHLQRDGDNACRLVLDKALPTSVTEKLRLALKEANFGVSKVLELLLRFLLEPCETRLPAHSPALLIFFMEMFHCLDVPVYVDMASAALVAAVPHCARLIQVRDELYTRIPFFEIAFWDFVLLRSFQLDDDDAEKAEVLEFLSTQCSSLPQSIPQNKLILHCLNESIKKAFTIELDNVPATQGRSRVLRPNQLSSPAA